MLKCAVITGAASGIGASIAKKMARCGHRVIIADINDNDGLALAREINATFIKTDLSKPEACASLITQSAEITGSVDILINNAGYQHVSPLEKFPQKQWTDMLQVMLTAPFLLTKYCWPYMKKNQWGRVVNIGSIHSLVASPNKVGYIAAKHGLSGLAKTAALEGGPLGITVNTVCPAYVKTPLVENQISKQANVHGFDASEVVDKIMLKSAAIKHLIEPDEIADLVMFLCSDSGRSITGSSYTVDCGWTVQ